MMKKMLCLLLALLLCPVLALADDSAAELLSYKELTVWAEGYIARALDSVPLNDPAQSYTEDGYEFVYDFATLYADVPMMSGDAVINAIVLTAVEENGPRAVNVNASLQEVLDAYYSENADLAGSREAAVLYALDNLPESAAWAQVNRDGQRVQNVHYAVHEQMPSGGEGYCDAGVIYTLVDHRVSTVRVYGLDARLDQHEVNDVLYGVMLTALENDYTQVPFSFNGAELAVFGQADMTFSGLNFLHMTAEDAAAVLGNPLTDEWIDNGGEGYIRVQRYASCELTWLYDKTRTQGSIYMLLVTADGLEGPRGVRCGDSFASVYNRFRHGEGAYQEDGSEVLYGDGMTGDFGKAEYGYDASAALRYGFTTPDGRRVALQMDFTVMALSQMMLYVE